MPPAPHREDVPSAHEFPARPVPAVGAVVFRKGSVLMVKRGSDPNRGRWSLPGGALEAGETVEAGSARETLEETGVVVRPVRVVDVRDFIVFDGTRVRWHFVLVCVLCEYVRGDPIPATDAANAKFLPLDEIGEYDVTSTSLDVLRIVSTAREIAGSPRESSP